MSNMKSSAKRKEKYKDKEFAKSRVVRCYYCNEKLKRKQATVDHFIPLTRGGEDRKTNFVISCSHCNYVKAATRPGIFLIKKFMERLPKKSREAWFLKLNRFTK